MDLKSGNLSYLNKTEERRPEGGTHSSAIRAEVHSEVMTRQRFLRLVFFVFRLCFIMLLFPWEASAHAPHDEVRAILLSPAYLYDGIVFAILRYNILRSTDFGYTWRRLTQGLPRCIFFDLAISPAFATDRCIFAASPDGGIFRSSDAGVSWMSLNDNLPDRHIDFLAISPTFKSDQRLLAAGREGQLYLTNDAGKLWRQTFRQGAQRVSAAAIVGPSIVIGTSVGSIHVSEDDGRSWHVLAQLQADQSITCFAAVDNTSTRSTILVGTGNGCLALAHACIGCDVNPAGLVGQHITSLVSTPSPNGHPLLFASAWREAVFRSEDIGRSWSRHDAGLTTDLQADWPQYRRPQFKGLTVSSTFAADQTLFLGGFDGVFKSTNGGNSWREMRGALPISLIVGLDLAPVTETDFRVAITTYLAGVYSRIAVGPWEVNNVGIDLGRLSDIAFSPNYTSDQTIFALGNWVLFKSTDDGHSWDATPLVASPRTLHQLKTRLYSILRRIVPILMRWCGRDRVLQLKQWFALKSMLAGEHIMGPGWGAILAVSPEFRTDRTLFIGGPSGVLRSGDGGSSFQSVFEVVGTPVRSLVVSPDFAHDGTVFVAFDECLYRSVDRGNTWEQGFQGREIVTHRLAISPAYRHDHTLFLGCKPGLWRSRDGGKQWQQLHIAAFPADAAVDGLAISPCFRTDQEVIAHVCGSGLFHSFDSGETFARVAIDHITPSPAASHMTGFPDRASLIRFSPHYGKDNTLFVSSMEELLKSSDRCRSWETVRRPVRYESVRPEIAYRGKWKIMQDKRFSSGFASCSPRYGDIAVMEFVGHKVSWIGRQGPGHGMARLLIDDVLVATVDQYAATLSFAVVSFETAELSYGPHTLVVEVTSDRNRQSVGNDIIIDAFDVI